MALKRSEENTVGKGENSGHHYFPLFKQKSRGLYILYSKGSSHIFSFNVLYHLSISSFDNKINNILNEKFSSLSNSKEFADDNFKFDENGGEYFKRVETVWEKEKLLVTSNLSFSYTVFKRLVLQTSKNKGLFGKELKV